MELNNRNIATIIASILLSIVFLVMVGCERIGPGNVGIKINLSGVQRGASEFPLRTGWVFYNRFGSEVVEYPTFVQTVKWTKSPDEGKAADESITFTTGKDSLAINADISLSYQLDAAHVPDFYVKFRKDKIEDFTDGFMRNVVRDAFNDIAGQYSVEDLMGDNGPIIAKVKAQVQQTLSPYGVEINQLGFIGSPRPPQSVIEAINMKVQAQQIALQKQTEVAQADAEARKNVAIAQGDAQANIVRAQADAQANKLRSESLTPALLEWTKIQKWNGQNPNVVGGGGGLIVSTK